MEQLRFDGVDDGNFQNSFPLVGVIEIRLQDPDQPEIDFSESAGE